jgi:hypothetical protein
MNQPETLYTPNPFLGVAIPVENFVCKAVSFFFELHRHNDPTTRISPNACQAERNRICGVCEKRVGAIRF